MAAQAIEEIGRWLRSKLCLAAETVIELLMQLASQQRDERGARQ